MPGSLRRDDPKLPVFKLPSNCVICKGLLGPSTKLGGRTCLQWSCQQELARRKREGFGRPKCRFCQLPLNIHMVRTGVCADSHCQAALRRANQREEAERRARALAAKIEALCASMGLEESDAPDAPYVFQIPASTRELVPCEAQRRAQLHAHLCTVFDELEAEQAGATEDKGEATDEASMAAADEGTQEADAMTGDDASEVPAALVAGACRSCQGFCCHRGEEHAYIKVETLQRVMESEPSYSREEIIVFYIDAVADRTCEGSCIFHAETGCSLPAAWRSKTCNDYFCGALHRFLVHSPMPSQDVVAVAATENEIVRVARFNEDEYVPLSIPDNANTR